MESSLTKDLTEVTRLGNQAVKMGLISGHGYYGGNYDILYKGQVFHLSPEAAHTYLKKLVEEHQPRTVKGKEAAR
jgi:hypothetical protein